MGTLTAGDKTCTRCHVNKPLNEYYLRPDRNVFNSQCRSCVSERIRIKRVSRTPEQCDLERAKSREYWASLPPGHKKKQRRNYFLLRRYGLTINDFNELLHCQSERCACCGGVSGRWHVDHDHATGKIRGILCHRCNVQLGQLGDSEIRILELCQRFIQYLRTHSDSK